MGDRYFKPTTGLFRVTAALVLALLLTSACAKREPVVLATKDIKPGQSIVIAKTVVRVIGTGAQGAMPADFRRFDPPKPSERMNYASGPRTFQAHDGPPGRYHFYGFSYPGGYYLYEPHNPRYEFEVKAGEAVYIGDIVQLTRGGRFSMRIENNAGAARAFFEKNFANSGLKFRTRLLRRIRKIEPILPK